MLCNQGDRVCALQIGGKQQSKARSRAQLGRHGALPGTPDVADSTSPPHHLAQAGPGWLGQVCRTAQLNKDQVCAGALN